MSYENVIKKAKKIEAPNNAVEMLLKQIENVSKQVSNRELTFLSIYLQEILVIYIMYYIF